LGSGAVGHDYSLTVNGATADGVIVWMENEDYFDFQDIIKLPYLGGAPANLANGMVWMSDGSPLDPGMKRYALDARVVREGGVA